MVVILKKTFAKLCIFCGISMHVCTHTYTEWLGNKKMYLHTVYNKTIRTVISSYKTCHWIVLVAAWEAVALGAPDFYATVRQRNLPLTSWVLPVLRCQGPASQRAGVSHTTSLGLISCVHYSSSPRIEYFQNSRSWQGWRNPISTAIRAQRTDLN